FVELFFANELAYLVALLPAHVLDGVAMFLAHALQARAQAFADVQLRKVRIEAGALTGASAAPTVAHHAATAAVAFAAHVPALTPLRHSAVSLRDQLVELFGLFCVQHVANALVQRRTLGPHVLAPLGTAKLL